MSFLGGNLIPMYGGARRRRRPKCSICGKVGHNRLAHPGTRKRRTTGVKRRRVAPKRRVVRRRRY